MSENAMYVSTPFGVASTRAAYPPIASADKQVNPFGIESGIIVTGSRLVWVFGDYIDRC
jgi:hypothetical protein